MSDFIRVVNGELQWSLHPGQVRAFNSTAQTLIVLAGTQGGKTSFGPLWLLYEIQRKGQGDYIVATPTFPLLELKLLPEFRRLFEKQLKLGKYVASPTRKFVFSEGGAKRMFGSRYDSEIPTQIFFGHAQDPDSLESATAKAAWLDEAGQKKFKVGSFQAIKRRLAIHEGRVLITTTPYTLGWLKDMTEKRDKTVEVVNFRSVDNPVFPISEYRKAKSDLPEWKFKMFYQGIFTRPAGMIYDVFDKDIHVIEPFEIPDEWRQRWIGIDFGGVNTAAVKFVRDPERDIYIAYAEYHHGGRTAREHCSYLLKDEPITPITVGGAPSEDDKRLEMNAGGLHVKRPPVSDVEVGIGRVYSLLKNKRLVFFKNLIETIDDIQRYSRELDERGEPTEAIEDKSTFHLGDAVRYGATLLEPNRKTQRRPQTHSHSSASNWGA